MTQVIVYTMRYCPFCDRAKALLKQRGVPFKEVMVADDDDTMWDELYRQSGMKTMPQIFFESGSSKKLIGGYQELSALDQQDQLISLK